MRKTLYTLLLCIAPVATALAGGLLHNTNQHIAFVRMMARGATSDIDAVYSNPAGSAFLDHQGWTLSLNNQSAFQRRDVEAEFPLFPEGKRQYDGKASAPILPSAIVAYQRNKWTFSGMFAMIGGGGKCSYDQGLPMFDAAVMAGIYSRTSALVNSNPAAAAVLGGPVMPNQYDLNTAMRGRQYIYGLQFGAAYRFNSHISAFAGVRFNYFDGNYRGHVNATAGEALAEKLAILGQGNTLANIELDCDQTGWGITPVIGFNYKVKGLTLAAKYEFKTNLNIENDTKTLNVAPTEFRSALSEFEHGVNTPSDLPAVLSLAAGYEILPNRLRATFEFHHYDDKNAEMASDKQRALTRGTLEYLLGVEWDINKTFTVSAGGQITDYGLSDAYQRHTSFACDSYSIGFGGAVNLTKKLRMNLGYFRTIYSNYTKVTPAGTPGYCNTGLAGTDVFKRKNKVFGIGFDYKF